MDIAIVGAGMAGLACAQQLAASGHQIRLFDKGRGAGGRMATRRLDTDLGPASFDHGAQYMTARAPGFVTQMEAWAAEGIVARWPAAGADAWVGTPAMNAPIKRMAAGLDVTWHARVERLAHASRWTLHGDGPDAGGFDAIIVAVPAEQVHPLLAVPAPAFAELADTAPSAPCWTMMAAFAQPLPANDIVRGEGPIAWAARNSAKPSRKGPESWVVQADPRWSMQHLDSPAAEVAEQMMRSFGDRLGEMLPPPIALAAHRWRYARSAALGRDCAWDPNRGIGLCGDWLIGPRVESAWLSGMRLAETIGAAT